MSAWGESWGAAWGGSWGAAEAPGEQPQAFAGGGGIHSHIWVVPPLGRDDDDDELVVLHSLQ